MSGTGHSRNFLRAFVVTLAVAICAMLAFNVIIDPFWRFDLVSIAGVNAQKPLFSANARMAKAGIVCRLQPKTMLFGTSRVEVGMNPADSAFAGLRRPIYNFGLAGSGLYELNLTLRHAVRASPHLEQALVGLDFMMFNAHYAAVVLSTEVIGFDEARLMTAPTDSCIGSFVHDLDNFVGPKGLVFSLATIAGQADRPKTAEGAAFSEWIANYDINGFRDKFDLLDSVFVPTLGYRGLFGDLQERYYLKNVWRPAPRHRYCFSAPGQPNTFSVFRQMLDFARSSGFALKLFINPIHARMLIAIRDGGLWPQYEDWKRGLVETLTKEARDSGGRPFELWDFSGFNSVTTESVPPGDDHQTIMSGYWEPSHYKAAVGNLMIAAMTGSQDVKDEHAANFGMRLTPENIEDWILRSRSSMNDYMRDHKIEADLVEASANDVMKDADGSNCGDDVELLRNASGIRLRGDDVGSTAALNKAISIHTADRERYSELGVPYLENGFDKLLGQFRRGVALEPELSNWIAYQDRGLQRSQEGRYAEAVNDFTQAILLSPPNTALYYLRGITRQKLGDDGGAVEDFTQALKMEPENVTLRGLLHQAKQTPENR